MHRRSTTCVVTLLMMLEVLTSERLLGLQESITSAPVGKAYSILCASGIIAEKPKRKPYERRVC